ncbi:ATP-grasp domain-containing protein [Phenylobacterium sp.]|uniref:ATP-grasp domain-containing protein n=1 Tax=Phenylobacterium sp. TaxID=1871053 RepID=UPI0025DFB17E|nr:ATP-grasp domain-containing protein [Phenylobacterium sp.]
MILLCGIPSEGPLKMVADRLADAEAEVAFFNQRRFADCAITLSVADGEVGGELRLQDLAVDLGQVRAAYSRVMDDRFLPELADEPDDSPLRARCRGLHDTMTQFIDVAPGRMVNRSQPTATNMSKPYQAQLIRRLGFLTPQTLITTDPEEVLAFRATHGRVIFKSISGVRSIVRTLADDDLPRLNRIRWCPTQFQAFVPGTEVRVHVVGTETFAAAVTTDATDYRYALQQTGEAAALRPVILSDELADQCVRLTRALGLEISGIDLKVTDDDEVYCFEVNPTPAFSYYEHGAGLPISASITAFLMAADRA